MGKKNTSRLAMIDGATVLFKDKGIAKVTMEDIGKRAGFTRRTVYRHFTSKDEIAYEVAISELEAWNKIQDKIAESAKGSGIECLEHFLRGISDYMDEHIKTVRFFADFDYYFNDQKYYQPSKDLVDRFNRIAHFTENKVQSYLVAGMMDGSIKEIKNVRTVTFTMTNFLWRYAQGVAIRGEHLRDEFMMKPIDLVHQQIDFYIQGVKKL